MAHVFAGTFGDGWFGMSLAWRWHGPLPAAHAVGRADRRGRRRRERRHRSRRRPDRPRAGARDDRSGPGAASRVGRRGRILDALWTAGLHHRRVVLGVPARHPRRGQAARSLPIGWKLHRRLPRAAVRPRGRVAPVPGQAAVDDARPRPGERGVSAACDLQDSSARASWPRAWSRRAPPSIPIPRARSRSWRRPAATTQTNRTTGWRSPRRWRWRGSASARS